MPFPCTHVRLLVGDFRASFLFYRDVLGLAVHSGEESGPYAEFKNGPHFIALFRRDFMASAVGAGEGGFSPESVGAAVLCFHVPDVDKIHQALKKKGVDILAGPADRPEWFLRTVHLRDPDGNIVELYQNRGGA